MTPGSSPKQSVSPDDSDEKHQPAGLPEGFVERLSEILAIPDLEPALGSFGAPRNVAFRVNTLVAKVEEVVEELVAAGLELCPVSWLESAFTVSAHDRELLLDSRPHREGRIYVQNLSSMIPPLSLDAQPGEEILDLAAAPGSKTHQMACAMRNTGRITAVEVVRARYYKLRDNMERLGADCVRPFFQDGTRTWRHRPEFFDRVLLDAPCSSEGRFRSDTPETTRYWSTRKVSEMSRKQRRLLYSAIRCLKPGGSLVYSTCSFSPEENEMVVHKLLAKFAGAVRVAPVPLEHPQFRKGLTSWRGREFDDSISMTRRIIPDATMDGFFVCRLE
ncbi:MAG: RsmB/NOP family class I SAM-dependent RNA methyltransferase, partial [Rhodothermia bacterium]|nr:RsmB/NOP family class I SAM-dependent RNA methyltransferase [Rhodothermia bacterium]